MQDPILKKLQEHNFDDAPIIEYLIRLFKWIKDTQITKHTYKKYFFFLFITFYYLYLQSNP